MTEIKGSTTTMPLEITDEQVRRAALSLAETALVLDNSANNLRLVLNMLGMTETLQNFLQESSEIPSEGSVEGDV